MSDPFSAHKTVNNPLYRKPGQPLKQEMEDKQHLRDDIPGSRNGPTPDEPPAFNPNRKSPVDDFSDIWSNDPDTEGKPKEKDQPPKEPKPTDNNKSTPNKQTPKDTGDDDFDPLKDVPDAKLIRENLKGRVTFAPENFEELSEKAMKGDAKALQELLNGYGEAVASQAIHMAMRGSAHNLKTSAGKLTGKSAQSATNSIRLGKIQGALMQAFPDLKKPDLKPVAMDVIQKFVDRMGDKDDEDIVERASKYFTQNFNVKAQETKSSKKKSKDDEDDKGGSIDWTSFSEDE